MIHNSNTKEWFKRVQDGAYQESFETDSKYLEYIKEWMEAHPKYLIWAYVFVQESIKEKEANVQK